ncbi:hypothetical protein C5167_020718 [Papaver somniferum]|uniref:Uncharacterized protein n=1 Tax=Papaver somniferum TaxID=3469 RepID=A0A4Y7IX47_PAPSO|nr:hypothetical protein C5167_020718 [Papaver somniferum]
MKVVPDNPTCSEFTTTGIRAVDSTTTTMAAATTKASQVEAEIKELTTRYIRLIWDRNSPDRDFNLLQIENLISIAEKKLESLQEVGDMEPTEMEDEIVIEEVIIDLSSAPNFTQRPSNPPVSYEVLGSFPATNRSHNLVEGNFRSTPLIVLSIINGSGSIDGSGGIEKTQKYKSTTMFLDYQEGKPFNFGNESCDADVGFQVRKVINGEVKGISLLNEFSGNTSSSLGVEEVVIMDMVGNPV